MDRLVPAHQIDDESQRKSYKDDGQNHLFLTEGSKKENDESDNRDGYDGVHR
jgi:hypothetical protein